MHEISRIFSSFGTMSLGMVCVAFATFAQTALLARELGPEGLGIMASVVAISAIVSALVSFRTTEAVTRWLAEPTVRCSPDAISALISSAILAEVVPRALAYILIVGSASEIALLSTGSEANSSLLMIHGVTILYSAPQSVWVSLMRDESRFSQIAGLEAFAAMIKLGVIGLAAITSQVSLFLAISAIACVAFFKAVYQSLLIKNSLVNRGCGGIGFHSAFANRRQLRGFWKLMFKGYLASTFISPFKHGDVLLLGALASMYEVGLYKTAKTFVTLLQSSAQTFASVIFKDINDELQNGRFQSLWLTLVNLTKIWGCLMLLLAVCSVEIVPLIINHVFGAQFIEGVTLFYILLAGALTGLIFFWAQQFSIALDTYLQSLNMFYITQTFCYVFTISATVTQGSVGLAFGVALHWTLATLVFLPHALFKFNRLKLVK